MVLLKRLPVSEIKVDRSFVQRMTQSTDDATIVRSIVELAHALGIEVVAEGVETIEAWDALDELGCDSAQGWYVGRPMPAAQATEWLLRHPSRSTALRVLRGGSASRPRG
jgi:EAL domain-containing protein (putative c-di-GMP-specific phosphodiesterase class I)